MNRWKAIERSRVPYYKTAERTFKNALNAQYKPVIDYINQMGGRFTVEDAVDLVESGEIKSAFDYVYSRTGEAFASKEFAKFAGQANDHLRHQFDQFMKEYVTKTAGKRVTSINGISKKYARKIISDTIAANPTMGADALGLKIQGALKSNGAKISRWRSTVIARTEVVTAANMGQQIGAEAVGVGMVKQWVATMDNRTRDRHLEAEGQTRAMNEDFIVGGEQMYVPGDARASAGNTVNCRCAVVYETL